VFRALIVHVTVKRLSQAGALAAFEEALRRRPELSALAGRTRQSELEEAAAVDGATRNQAFRSVILPLAVPALAVMMLRIFRRSCMKCTVS